MFNLKKLERFIIIFLVSTLVLGLAIVAYKRSRSNIDLRIKPFNVEGEKLRDVDRQIDEAKMVNINKASLEDIMRLKGIGKILAERIIEYRSEKGRFYSKQEIKNVDGIGEKIFEDIKDRISVE